MLFLSLKQSGRAKTLKPNLLSHDDLILLYQAARYSEFHDCSDLFLTKHEGEYSMFIDAVKMKAYTSSYKDDGGIDLRKHEDYYCTPIDVIFGEICKKNGFQVFERPTPYYRK